MIDENQSAFYLQVEEDVHQDGCQDEQELAVLA